jgi:hypothetical protein
VGAAISRAVLPLVLLSSASFAQPGVGPISIPPVKAAVQVDGTPLEITAWGEVSMPSRDNLQAALTADLSDLQKNLTALLRSQLDRSDRCGERLAVASATLVPAPPAALLSVNVHYERWACAKVFGKDVTKRLVGGNGAIQARLTLSSAAEGIAVASEVQKIDADGALGELLQSGSLGASLREKIARSIESAIRKSVNSDSLLPPSLQSIVTIRSIEFADGGAGRLWVSLHGRAQFSPEQFLSLSKQFNPR